MRLVGAPFLKNRPKNASKAYDSFLTPPERPVLMQIHFLCLNLIGIMLKNSFRRKLPETRAKRFALRFHSQFRTFEWAKFSILRGRA